MTPSQIEDGIIHLLQQLTEQEARALAAWMGKTQIAELIAAARGWKT